MANIRTVRMWKRNAIFRQNDFRLRTDDIQCDIRWRKNVAVALSMPLFSIVVAIHFRQGADCNYFYLDINFLSSNAINRISEMCAVVDDGGRRNGVIWLYKGGRAGKKITIIKLYITSTVKHIYLLLMWCCWAPCNSLYRVVVQGLSMCLCRRRRRLWLLLLHSLSGLCLRVRRFCV